ncbi:DNA-binding domain-containing protein [Thioclava sp. 'Guangxiensis']|uniref:HvfC/BufC family peptide modification chaperone n=1 Tax=Thioclava sp. 'Guangxiensis' TaxID=3149044 RepID=UPI003877A2DF
MSHETQFIAGLRGQAKMPDLAIDHPPAEAARRFSVYRNNVAVALTAALRAGFPAVEALVGHEFFTAMAREFIRDHPPRDPVMACYGGPFAGWLEGFAPVVGLPYLPEVACIEMTLRLACHARDCAVVTQETLGESVGAGIVPHPAAHCLSLRSAALSAWARNSGRPDLKSAAPGEVLITRPHADVLIAEAPRGTKATFSALSQGRDLEVALEGRSDPVAILSCLVRAGALTTGGR